MVDLIKITQRSYISFPLRTGHYVILRIVSCLAYAKHDTIGNKMLFYLTILHITLRMYDIRIMDYAVYIITLLHYWS